MIDTTVTRFPGVTRRPDSAVWWFVLRAPKDLRHRFDGKAWAVRRSLGTSDLRQANEEAKALHAEWAQRFAAMRLEDTPQALKLSAALVASVVAEVRRWVLEADDNFRDFHEGPRGLLEREERRRLLAAVEKAEALPLPAPLPLLADLSGLTIAAAGATPPPSRPPQDPLGGLTEAQAGALGRYNAEVSTRAGEAYSRRTLAQALPLAVAVSRSLGWQADWTTPEGRAGLLEVLKAHRQAAADTVRKDAGEVVDTPEPQQRQEAAPAPPTKRHTGADAFDAWKRSKPGRPAASVGLYKQAATKLDVLLTGKCLEEMTSEDGLRVVEVLRAEGEARGPKGINTAFNLKDKMSTLLNVAVRMEWARRNYIKDWPLTRVQSDRDEWQASELVKLFDDPLFTAYELPQVFNSGNDGAYWLPLLGLYTGARIAELAQLHTDDVMQQEGDGWVLSLKPDGKKGQRVKNRQSVRLVPVHSELVRLGFIDYWQAMQDGRPGALWPAWGASKLNAAGGRATGWFSKYKTAKGFGPLRVFHSFRHTLENRLKALQNPPVPRDHINAIAGHAGQGTGDQSYTNLKPADVRPTLERLRFPGLNLPRVFSAPVFSGRKGAA